MPTTSRSTLPVLQKVEHGYLLITCPGRPEGGAATRHGSSECQLGANARVHHQRSRYSRLGGREA